MKISEKKRPFDEELEFSEIKKVKESYEYDYNCCNRSEKNYYLVLHKTETLYILPMCTNCLTSSLELWASKSRKLTVKEEFVLCLL